MTLYKMEMFKILGYMSSQANYKDFLEGGNA